MPGTTEMRLVSRPKPSRRTSRAEIELPLEGQVGEVTGDDDMVDRLPRISLAIAPTYSERCMALRRSRQLA